MGARRWFSVMAAAVVVAGGLQVVTSSPAAALPSYTVRTGTSGVISAGATKWALAECELTEQVVGGGAEIIGEPQFTTAITSMEPLTIAGLTPPRFYVQARALRYPDVKESWQVKAYAWCAPEGSIGSYVVHKTTTASSQAKFRAGTSTCTGGRVAYSAGVTTSRPADFGVQMVRTSGPLDIARASVRAFNSVNTPESWMLSTYAVCGLPRDGIVSAARVQNANGGVYATVSCPVGTQQINGSGGGLGLADGGENWIRTVRPASVQTPGTTQVRMTLLNPGEVVAATTCGTRT